MVKKTGAAALTQEDRRSMQNDAEAIARTQDHRSIVCHKNSIGGFCRSRNRPDVAQKRLFNAPCSI